MRIIVRLAGRRSTQRTPSLSYSSSTSEDLVSVDAHSLGASAHLAIGSRADRSAGGTTTVCAALLQCKQLLGTESLVVDLGSGLDEVLEVGSEQKVSQVDEFAVVLVLNVDDTPAVLAPTDLLAIDDDVLLRANNRKRNQALQRNIHVSSTFLGSSDDSVLYAYLDLLVQSSLLVVKLLVIVREHLEVVESKLGLDTLLEFQSLLNSQGVSLGNDRHNVDNIGQLLQDDNINGLERVAGRLNEEQTGVDAGVGDVTLSLGGKLLSQVRGVLVLDVLDDRVPTAVVVDKVAVAGGVDDVESQTDTILLNEVRDALDLGGLANGLVRLQTTLGVDEVRGEDGVNERRLAQASLACQSS